MYGLKYILEFSTLKRNSIRVEFHKAGYVGGVEELQGSSTPLVIESDDEDFLYEPILKSKCKIQIYTSSKTQDLFSTNYKEWKIVITKNGVVIWNGYINPEMYTQDYTNSNFMLDLECISALSVLEYIPFSIDEAGYISISDLLIEAVKCTSVEYDKIIIPNTYDETILNILINKANFYNEEGEAMMWLEVLSEVCKYLNWTITDWNGELFFVDRDFDEYTVFDSKLNKIGSYQARDIEIQSQLKFAGGDHTLDILPGYTAASVRSNSYTPESIKTDFDELDNIGNAYLKYNSDRFMDWQFLADSSQMTTYKYNLQGSEVALSEWLDTPSDISLEDSLFSCLGKSFTYKSTRRYPESVFDKSTISYVDAILVRTLTKKPPFKRDDPPKINYHLPSNSKVLRVYNHNVVKYPPGAISIDFKIEAMKYIHNSTNVNMIYPYGDTNGIEHIKCMLRLGEYYYTDSGSWSITPTSFKIPLNDSSPMAIKSNKRLFTGPDKAKGYVVNMYDDKKVGSNPLLGDLEFIMYASTDAYSNKQIGGYSIIDFSISFDASLENKGSVKESDKLYENAVNDKFINKLDTIEFKVNTFAKNGLSLSHVLLGNNYLDNIPNKFNLQNKYKQEELLINRIINQYKQPKLKLTQQLENYGAAPTDLLRDRFSPGVYSISSVTSDVSAEQIDIKMIQNERN